MNLKINKNGHQAFSSRWGFLSSVLGVAIGTGNIWRFPRIVAQNGSALGAGAFLVSWVFFLFVWSIPLIIAEYALGRKSQKGVIGTFTVITGPKTTWMGGFVTFVSAGITFYYAVVVGWCLFYLIKMVTTPLPISTVDAFSVWNSFQSSVLPTLFHGAALILGTAAIWKGVPSIEKLSRWIIPVLLGILFLSLFRTLTLPNSLIGIRYLFTPEWTQLLNVKIWLEALSQNAWDTGAGWGLLLTYSTYMDRQQPLVKNAVITGIGNNVVSLIAGIIIFGTVFSILKTDLGMTQPEVLNILRSTGPASTGLTLIWIPQLFARMELGSIFAILFFFGLSLAGFSSLMSMLELQTRVLLDTGIGRTRSVLLVGVISFLLGIPSARSLTFFGNQDFVWGIALVISGTFIAYAALSYGCSKLRKEEMLIRNNDIKLGRYWDVLIKYFIPIGAIILLCWWFILSAMTYTQNESLDPFKPYSIMTCLFQWSIAFFLLYYFNRKITKLTLGQNKD